MEEENKVQGLSKEQIQGQLDQFESQRVAFEQEKILLEFDVKNYKETLERKIRLNFGKLKLVSSNIEVLKKQLSEIKD